MPITIYEISTPVFIRALGNLSSLLNKAEAFCTENELDPAALIEARLAPDMFTLARQVQGACDAAKAAIGRLAEVERPSFPDTEETFSELQERITKTVHFIEGVDREKFDGAANLVVTIRLRGGDMEMTGLKLLLQFALPNFYFHMTTAYDILRHKGMQIGKMDYLGTF